MTVLVAVSITDTVPSVIVGDVGAGAVGADRHAVRAAADGDGRVTVLVAVSITDTVLASMLVT